MKLCAIICEINPFHNGHEYLLKQAIAKSGCDGVICIMSGCFTQRGEVAILDKFTRAKHAVMAGADAIIELPAPLSVAPAEIFAKGAIKILSSIPSVTTLCFGCENEVDFMSIAKKLLSEDEKFKSALNKNLTEGQSYIKSYTSAFEACGGDGLILAKPNNILAIEYAKAILTLNANIKLLPIKRIGGGYSDKTLVESYSSASAIRENISNEQIKNNVPSFVYNDIKSIKNYNDNFEKIVKYALIKADKQSLKNIIGCNEGLENSLKNYSNLPLEQLIDKASGKRYSHSRIRRILVSNALGIYENDVIEILNSDLYIKPLCVSNDKKDTILSELSKSNYPIVITGSDASKLSGTAKKCFNLDLLSQQIWDLITTQSTYTFTLKTI
jgi:predicted nucleotidyltransferase